MSKRGKIEGNKGCIGGILVHQRKEWRTDVKRTIYRARNSHTCEEKMVKYLGMKIGTNNP